MIDISENFETVNMISLTTNSFKRVFDLARKW